MSIYRNSLAFSVIHYYLSEFAKKHQFLLPPFPKHLQLIDVSSFISQAEDIVLGNSSSKEIIVNERLSSLFENISLENGHQPNTNLFSYEYRE